MIYSNIWLRLKSKETPNRITSTTPWKINMEPTNHPFRKENDLPNLHDYGVYHDKMFVILSLASFLEF